MAAPEQFPDHPERVTANWMTEALTGSTGGARVERVEVLDKHSGTTGRIRLALSYSAGEGPESVFVKLPPFDEAQRGLVSATDMGRREARFYAGPAAEVPMRVPQCFHAAYGEDATEYVMVLEDLAARGCTFTNRMEPHAEEYAGKLIAGLARVHAHFWNDPRFGDEYGWVQPSMRGRRASPLIEQARDQFSDDMPPVFRELCDLVIEHNQGITALLDEGEETLIHGDCHAGNQFGDGDEVGLYDWAVISRSPGIRDISIYLGNSCPTELRRAQQESWLRMYRQTLIDSGVDAPTYHDLWERFRLHVIYAWSAATSTAAMGSKWQPIEVGMLGMQRATATCGDLETVEAFRARLG